MLGFGFGGNSRLRFVRIGLLVFIVLLGLGFHHQGKTYDTIRIVYYVAIVGLLLYGAMMRRRGGQFGGPGAGRGGFGRRGGYLRGGSPWANPSAGGQPPPAGDPVAQGTPSAAGWYAQPGNSGLESYWDGQHWGARRRWNGQEWVPEG